MAAPTIGTNAANQYASAGGIKTYSLSKGTAKGLAVALVCKTIGGATSWTTSMTRDYGGVTIPVAHDTGNIDTRHRIILLFLDDLSAVSGSTLTIQVPDEAAVWEVWYGLIEHTAEVLLLDTGEDVTEGSPASVALDTGGTDGRVIAAAVGGQEITASGMTSLFDMEFFGGYHGEGGHKTLTGSGTAEFTAGSGLEGAAAMVIGGTDVLLELASRLEVAWEVRAGYQLETDPDVLLAYAQAPRVGWEVRAGFRLVASTGKRQVAIVAGGIETSENTEGGDEGDILTQHADRPPTWEAAGAITHPDLTTHDALGLATDSELAAHTGDTSDAHDASAISIADAGGHFTGTDVEAALQELGAAVGSLDNPSASADPTVNDDSGDGYSVGSVWINTTASPRRIFRCVDATAGAAIWLRLVTTKGMIYSGSIANGATYFFADADIDRTGGGFIVDDGNTACAIANWYRLGTFNLVSGLASNGNIVFRGTTFSPGAVGLSFYIEGNSAGHRLAVKNNLGFARGVYVFDHTLALS